MSPAPNQYLIRFLRVRFGLIQNSMRTPRSAVPLAERPQFVGERAEHSDQQPPA